jgi:hypothetical protein
MGKKNQKSEDHKPKEHPVWSGRCKVLAKRNPMSYRDIRNKTGLGLATISKVIHHDLDLETKNKTKVHKLSEENKKNRKTNCRKLYEKYLASDRWKYAVTLDEALVYLDDSNKESRICC